MELSNWGLGASGLIVVIGLIGHEFIKTLITKFFANLSKTEINVIFILIIGGLALGAFPIGTFIEKKTENPEVNNTIANSPRTKEEVYLEGGKFLIEKGEDLAEKKRKKDSLRQADKPHKWVYQIGPSIAEKEDLFYKYRLLKDFGNVYIFKESRKSYLIILDDGNISEENLKQSLESIQNKVAVVERNVSVIDLMTYCSWKEQLKKVKNITERKETIELPCMECDK